MAGFGLFVHAETNVEDGASAIAISSIVIMPAEVPLERAAPSSGLEGDGLESGRLVLNELLVEYAAGLSRVEVVGDGELEGKLIDVSGSRQVLARKVGSQFGGDAVMISTIRRFDERDAAQSRPASVAFDYQLVVVESGQILCSGVFDETQEPLFDNIFSFRRALSRKFKWISARELAREGLSEKLNNCFYLRRDQQKVP
jgi:hypothetical protein